ncbi:MAG TPA: hypothetical protein VIG30_13135 [Ktedonobacterales bacterium]|jgi:hypothetical protein
MTHLPVNIRLNRFVLRAITPVVLLGGLLLLLVYHFHGVLAVTQAQDNAFRGVTALSSGPLQVTFLRDSGTQRPLIQWNGIDLMTYADWSSTVAVDGQVTELWNTPHGYTFDQAEQRIYATSSNAGWQVIDTITLVDSQTVRVDYRFVVLSSAAAPPKVVQLTVAHQRVFWYQPAVTGTTFRAQVPAVSGAAAMAGQASAPVGTVTLAVAGAGPVGMQLGDTRGVVGPDGARQEWASSLMTMYDLTNPPVDALTPLGTETLTFAPSAADAGTPVAAPVQTQTP